MLRYYFLYLTDRRLWAAMKIISACAAALGDLADTPQDAARFFAPHRSRLARALKTTAPAAGGAVAADDFAARLENFFSGLALHKTAADPALTQALLYLQAACAAAPALLSPPRRAGALERIRGFCASGEKTLRLAMTAAQARQDNFPQNLKFCSIYSGLGAVFDSFEHCAAALYKS